MFYALIQRAVIFAALVLACVFLLLPEAFAQSVAQAPVGDTLFSGLISLWGPFLGIIAAFVLFFDRLAKVIPNGTTSSVLKGILWAATILGVKVPDNQ